MEFEKFGACVREAVSSLHSFIKMLKTLHHVHVQMKRKW